MIDTSKTEFHFHRRKINTITQQTNREVSRVIPHWKYYEMYTLEFLTVDPSNVELKKEMHKTYRNLEPEVKYIVICDKEGKEHSFCISNSFGYRTGEGETFVFKDLPVDVNELVDNLIYLGFTRVWKYDKDKEKWEKALKWMNEMMLKSQFAEAKRHRRINARKYGIKYAPLIGG